MPHDVTLQKFPLKSGTVKGAYDRKKLCKTIQEMPETQLNKQTM